MAQQYERERCKLTKKCTDFRRADLVELASSCGVNISRTAPLKGQKNMAELCEELIALYEASVPKESKKTQEALPKEVRVEKKEEVKKEGKKEEVKKEEPSAAKKQKCRLTKKCKEFRRVDLVQWATDCGISIARAPPLRGQKTMDELCDELIALYGPIEAEPKEIAPIKEQVLVPKEKIAVKERALVPIVASPFPPDIQTYLENALKLFNKYGYTSYIDGWFFFTRDPVTDEPATDDPAIDERASNQWKVFYNPKREYFFPVLETILATLKADKVHGKIVLNPFRERKHGGIWIDNPHEPKIVLYYMGKTSAEAKKMLREQTLKVFDNLPIEHLEDISLGCDTIIIDKNKIIQCGPSFTEKLNPLAYYTQGGFTESSRAGLINDAAGQNIPASQLLRKEYAGKQFHKYIGETEPFTAEDLVKLHPKHSMDTSGFIML